MQKGFKKFAGIFIIAFFFAFLFFTPVLASTTNGTIDSTYKYAWADDSGWFNFGATNGNVQITDSGITGYIWNENYGWVNMSPTFGGVLISSAGALSGYAWGENIGWINFTGTSINCSGQFTGTASSDTAGTITFTCTNCKVITDYLPQTCRTSASCGDGTCNGSETCSNCPTDCGDCGGGGEICGNGYCRGAETCSNCPTDCGACPPFCGDTKCNGNETCGTCSADCGECLIPPPPPFCGNGACSGSETCVNCAFDCGECPNFCGDTKCNGNETCGTCSADCGECLIPPPSSCGDRVCDNNETCNNCPTDCKECATPPPPVIPPVIPGIIFPSIIDIIIKIVTTGGLIIMAIATVMAPPLSLSELFLLPMRLIGLLLIAFGWKKRNPPWGVVYDSVTKQPLDPAYVTLKDLEGKDVSSAITDLDGRYGFLAEPGFYKMMASKTNYTFPSQKLNGKVEDELYDNLYFGAQTEIKRDEVITRNIPMDPIKFDWNEYTKQNKSLTKFYTRWDSFFRKISDFIYFIGFIVAIIAFFASPYPYNTIILGLYIFLLVLRIIGIKPKPYGSVAEKLTKNPLGFAILRIMDPASDREISHKITDKYGRYFCLVPKGKYYVKIEKKNSDASYSLIFKSEIIDASKNGIIKENFKILNEA